MFSGVWQAMLEFAFAEMVRGLTEFFTMMNNMGADTLGLAWIEAMTLFFHYIGWTLFLVGCSVAVFDCVIESQNGKASLRDLAINLIKGFMAVSLFTVVPVELFKFSVSLQGSLGSALCTVFQIDAFASIPQMGLDFIGVLTMVNPFNLFVLIGLGYCIIKIFFANIKRGGILVINIAVGSMYMLSVPRGFMDGFFGWCKQVAALCLTIVLQTTILTAGLLTVSIHPLLGLGLMFSANEVPRIAERFGIDTSVRVNFMSTYYAFNSMVNTIKGIAKIGVK